MASTAQKRASHSYRTRLGERGMARFEVLGRTSDRELIRALARQLTENTLEAEDVRAPLQRAIAPATPAKGGILAALLRSPLVGADLDIRREQTAGRSINL